jgi:hypothetical protein
MAVMVVGYMVMEMKLMAMINGDMRDCSWSFRCYKTYFLC